jgi:hypothetical protein
LLRALGFLAFFPFDLDCASAGAEKNGANARPSPRQKMSGRMCGNFRKLNVMAGFAPSRLFSSHSARIQLLYIKRCARPALK